eukprot:GHUV01052009.1.p1 GENE.GHUV01052009.1~~GHUV01052009.1.p1  ORF type:complete len:135 (-),score=30.34 GHUV01052009.1:221-625(-)
MRDCWGFLLGTEQLCRARKALTEPLDSDMVQDCGHAKAWCFAADCTIQSFDSSATSLAQYALCAEHSWPYSSGQRRAALPAGIDGLLDGFLYLLLCHGNALEHLQYLTDLFRLPALATQDAGDSFVPAAAYQQT